MAIKLKIMDEVRGQISDLSGAEHTNRSMRCDRHTCWEYFIWICQNVRTAQNLRHRHGFRTTEVRKDHQKHT